jgi:transcription termination factor Rho
MEEKNDVVILLESIRDYQIQSGYWGTASSIGELLVSYQAGGIDPAQVGKTLSHIIDGVR